MHIAHIGSTIVYCHKRRFFAQSPVLGKVDDAQHWDLIAIVWKCMLIVSSKCS